MSDNQTSSTTHTPAVVVQSLASAGCSKTPTSQITEVPTSGKAEVMQNNQLTRRVAKRLKRLKPGLVDMTADGQMTLGTVGMDAVKAAYEVYKSGGSNSCWFTSHDLLVVFRKKEK